jgi:hypothetical protein
MGFPIKFVLLCSLLIANCSFVIAQDAGYFLDTGSEEIRFIQRLTWTGDEYAWRYEVVIEREEGAYRELLRQFTTAPFIEVSLLPGKYRCLVIPYDFLDQAGERSEWIYIEVFAALNPVLDDSLPQFIYSGNDGLFALNLLGKNLFPGVQIFLFIPGAEPIVPYMMNILEDGSNVRLFFEEDQMVAGAYELIVINPGGLQAGRSGISFAPPKPVQLAGSQKPLYLFVGAAWEPSFTIYGEETHFSGHNMSLLGFAARFGVVLTRWNFFGLSPGSELTASYNYFGTGSGAQAHFLAFGLNLLGVKWLPGNRMAFTIRFGAGYSLLFADGEGFSDWGGSIHANVGVSFVLLPLGPLYAEIGIDYVYWFAVPSVGALRPWIGVGVWF